MPTNNALNLSLSGATGTGAFSGTTSPQFTTPILGIPSSGTLTSCTGLPIAGITGLGTGIGTFMATPSSANLLSAMTDKTGTGAALFATSGTMVTPVLGTPTSGNMTNCTNTYGLKSFQHFTSGSALTYTRPANCNAILVELVGGGGGGGGVSAALSQSSAASGGGSGAYGRKYFGAAAATYTYTVGTKGTGGATGANNGNAGNQTSFDTVTAPGGGAGNSDAASATDHVSSLGGAGGAAGANGDINMPGNCGSVGYALLGSPVGGKGGSSYFGGAGYHASLNTDGIAASGFGGGGGGGAANNSATTRAGGNGFDGLIAVWEFY